MAATTRSTGSGLSVEPVRPVPTERQVQVHGRPQPGLPPALPDRAVLAHVGIHKTGTTAIQSILAQQRAVLADAGVLYPGEVEEAHHKPALALSGTRWGPNEAEGDPVDPRYWTELRSAVQARSGRAVVSSEFFADLRGEAAERLVEELGREGLHVVIGVRPLALVLPSVWQQTLKMGRYATFERWLNNVYLGPHDVTTPRTFWSRYGYGSQVSRWVDLVGPDRVSVVVLDDTDRTWQPRVFEALLDLPAGTLAAVSPSRTNRSLTWAEAEAMRKTNRLLRRAGLAWDVYEPVVRKGVAAGMVENREPARDEARIHVPGWALEHAVTHGRLAVEQITASGARVVGHLETLGEVPPRLSAAIVAPNDEGTSVRAPQTISVDAFAQAVAGSVRGAQTAGVSGTDGELRHQRVADTTAPDLLKVLLSRIGRRLRHPRRQQQH